MKNLELYVHIPFCVKKCDYCDFLSFPAGEDMQKDYVEALLLEIAHYGVKCREYRVSTVYIGGGTPSWLRETQIARIMDCIHRSFSVADGAEVTIECNPGTVTSHMFSVYRRAGINRISIGMQSADDAELQKLGRIHTFEQFLKTYSLARENGFGNINLDLIYSLPGQTMESFCKTLQQVLRLKPEHVSAYSLIIEKGTPFYEKYKFDAVKQQAGLQPVELPTEDAVYRMTKLTEQALAAAGYEHYEVSNFAKPGFACVHNIGYWRRENYLGLGLGAASLMENIRYTNIREIYRYIEESKHLRDGLWLNESESPEEDPSEELPATNLHASAERVGRKAQIEEFMFLGLRMTEGVTRADFERAFGVSIESVYADTLTKLQEEGLLSKRAGRVFLTEAGQDVSNYALAKFLL